MTSLSFILRLSYNNLRCRMTYQKSGEMLSLLYLGDDVINGDILINLNRVEEVNVVF